MANKELNAPVTIIGAGLAGTEATAQLIRRSIPVKLIENAIFLCIYAKFIVSLHSNYKFALVCE